MPNLFIQGEKCYLRGLTTDDATPQYLSWLNDYEVTRYLETGRTPSTLDSVRDFIHAYNQKTNGILLAVCDAETDQHIGNVSLHDIHPVHRRGNFAILIGDKSYWGKGYGSEATQLTIDYGFRRWNLHSIWLGVLTINKAAIRAYEKVGFVAEGTQREAWWADGAWHDVLMMSILARDYFAKDA